MTVGVAQVVVHLPGKTKTLNSNPRLTKIAQSTYIIWHENDYFISIMVSFPQEKRDIIFCTK
jgi:hypothetical protein